MVLMEGKNYLVKNSFSILMKTRINGNEWQRINGQKLRNVFVSTKSVNYTHIFNVNLGINVRDILINLELL